MLQFASKVMLPLMLLGIFAADPTSTNYTLKNYDFGNGGGSGSSTNYKVDGLSGSQSGDQSSSTNYKLDSGEIITQNASTPVAPTFTNPSSEYKRLRLVLNVGTDPTDVRYNIAISDDNFVTTNYIQTDNSIGPGLTIANYQTYVAWGGASGIWVTGLVPNTTYKVKVRSLQGDFTGSPYSPTATASTILPTLTFSVATSTNPTPPFSVGFNSLTPGSVFDANADAVLTISSNAMFGGGIYVKSLNSGLKSNAAAFTIASATANLSSASSGYGGIVTSLSQSAGGPITAVTPFDGVSSNVGILSTNLQQLASTSSAITTGSVTLRLKAKSSATVPSATDYTDTLTFIAAMMF